MPKRGESGKRLKLVVGLAISAAALSAGVAFAAPATIVGTGANTFDAPSYAIGQGEAAFLRIAGGTHNVTASRTGPDGKALFRSATISSGSTQVDGTQYLTAGSYPFICSIHPTTMQATLEVTGSGSPQARPAVTLRLRSGRVEKVARSGLLQIAVTSNANVGDVSLSAKLGKATLGRAAGLSLVVGQQPRVLKLSKKGRKKLATRKKATITLDASVPFGSPARVKGKLK